MKKLLLVILVIVTAVTTIYAQKKPITVEEIYNGTFRTKSLDALRSLNNGMQYTLLNRNRETGVSTIDTYDYKTLEKVETVVSSADLSEMKSFSAYEFSADESQLLLATEVESVFRRSTLGKFFVYNISSRKLTPITNTKIREPALSPDGKTVAYVKDNNLYLFDLATASVKQLTQDGEKNKIINGVTDWVYEEEFAFTKAFDWNADGSKLAFIRFDETQVPEFSMDMYGTDLYPAQETFKYPKAGENNAVVSLHIYDVTSAKTSAVDLGQPYYIARMQWMNKPGELSVQTLNRHQNSLKLQVVNTDQNAVRVLLEEKDEAYVDVTDNLTFLKDDSFIWTSEKDGYNHIYHYGQNGKLKNQVTKGVWEVTNYYGYDTKTNKIYYQSTENGSINRGVYAIKANGKNKTALADTKGTNSADFSADFTYFINTFSSVTTPPVYTLQQASSGKVVKEIINNEALLTMMKGYQFSAPEFSNLTINGNDLNMYMVKPVDFEETNQYPLLMYQYSGPGSQSVANSWLNGRDMWHQAMAAKGYIIACVDGRGTGFKGRDFKKATYLNLVKLETEDQIAAASKLSELPFIDEKRTGIWGWSFGGHMATNAILRGNEVFEAAIAVAPVTSWRFYDTIYTERFMRTPEENPGGYDDNSPFNYPELLKGKFLLVHGSGDDNVHVQNSMRMIEALVQANKTFDWAIYPDKNHGIYGGMTRVHLFNKMTRFIEENL